MRLNFNGGRTVQRAVEPKKMAMRPIVRTCARTVRPTASNGLPTLYSTGDSQRSSKATDSFVELHTRSKLSIISYRFATQIPASLSLDTSDPHPRHLASPTATHYLKKTLVPGSWLTYHDGIHFV